MIVPECPSGRADPETNSLPCLAQRAPSPSPGCFYGATVHSRGPGSKAFNYRGIRGRKVPTSENQTGKQMGISQGSVAEMTHSSCLGAGGEENDRLFL